MAAHEMEFPDEAVFKSKKGGLDKLGNFTTLKKGIYAVTHCETATTGYGKRYKVTLKSKDGVEVTLWAPNDFATNLRKEAIKWKTLFFLKYDGTEERVRKDEEGTYVGYIYTIVQPTDKKMTKKVSVTYESVATDKTKGKGKSKADGGSESEA
jgi:hypothetical protein